MSDENDHDEQSGGGGLWLLGFFGIPLLPSAFVAFLFYSMLRYGRQRLSVIASLAAIVSVITIFVGSVLDAFTKFGSGIDAALNLDFTFGLFVPALIVVNIVLGSILGVFLSWWEIRSIKNSPHRLEISGSWTYRFKYRKTPWEILLQKRLVKSLRKGEEFSEERAPLGLDEEHNSIAFRYSSESFKHTMITGAPGSGKTITLLSLILNDITSGASTVVIDFKRSPKLASKLARFARENGAEFYHFVNGEPDSYDIADNPRGQSFYDCLSSGSPTSRADMVLGMREYDTASAVYKAAMQQLLQVVFAALAQADRSKAPSIDWRSGGIYQLASVVRGNNLQELASACEGTKIERDIVEVYEASKGKTQIRHALDELQGQMRTIIASEYGQWMKTSGTDRDINLFELTSKPGNVILFSLNSDSEKEFAQYVGSMIMADLTAVSARRRNMSKTNPLRVYVDEFQAVNPDSVKSLLEKSRESRMAITLAQQSFEQVITSSERNGEAYLGSLLDTCSNFIIHAGATEDSAVKLSKILGKHWVPVYRASNDHEGFFLSLNWKNRRHKKVTSSEEERWIFGPSKFMKLQSPDLSNSFKSTAVIVNKTSVDPKFASKKGAVAREVWMIPCDKVLEDEPVDALVEPRVKRSNVFAPSASTDVDLLDELDRLSEPDRFADDDDGGFMFEELESDRTVGMIDDERSLVEKNEPVETVLEFDHVEPAVQSTVHESEPTSSAIKAVERMSSFDLAMKTKLPEVKKDRDVTEQAVSNSDDDDDIDLPEL